MNMNKIHLFLIFCVAFLFQGCQKQKHTFEIGKETFRLDGKEFMIRSGELHYDRIPREYWKHRLQMAKAMGLNTVCTYVFWNKVEPTEGYFDEQNLQDMADFCRLAQKEGLWVVLRPGPYVCAEWDMGGLPWWLLKKEDIGLRSQDPYFLECSRKYLHKVGQILAPLQITNGGPVIMVQVENEYGHYGTDIEYLGKIKEYILEAGFDVPLFQCDYYTRFVDRKKDLFCAVNFGSTEDPKVCFDSLRKVMPEGPVLISEFYPGWLDHWGEKHGLVPTERVAKNLTYFLEHKASFNFYMLHGGTSFGMWSGANHPETAGGSYQPQTSSYDYDAPISEAGWDTPKYHELRNIIGKYIPEDELAPVPERFPTMSIDEFELVEWAPVTDNLPQGIRENSPKNMEAYNQGYGYIVYSTKIKAGASDSLLFDKVSDFAVVLLDDEPVAYLDRRKNERICELPARASEVTLQVIVEATGRVNSEKYLTDRKGVVGKVYLKDKKGNHELTGWDIYPVPLSNDKAPGNLKFGTTEIAHQPAYYRGHFNATEQQDVFLNVSNWGKGLVWVNGHCLGRFWHIGPTQTMYLPGPWIKKGENEIIILDFLSPEKKKISGQTTPILDSYI